MKHTIDGQHDIVVSALPLDFLDHLSAGRGIQRAAASALLGEWLLAKHEARRWRRIADSLARAGSAETTDVENAGKTDERQDEQTKHI